MSDQGAPITITATDDGLAVAGEIDAFSAPALAEAIDATEHGELIVDLAGVDFVDSSGLRVLLQSHQQLQAAGRALRLRRPSPVVQRLFDVAGVDGYLDVIPDA